MVLSHVLRFEPIQLFSTNYILVVWSNGCPSYGDTMWMYVHTLPTVDAGPDRDICLDEPVQMHALAGGDSSATFYTYEWSPVLGLDDF